MPRKEREREEEEEEEEENSDYPADSVVPRYSFHFRRGAASSIYRFWCSFRTCGGFIPSIYRVRHISRLKRKFAHLCMVYIWISTFW